MSLKLMKLTEPVSIFLSFFLVLNKMYAAFDRHAESLSLQKIDIVGDAYVVGGPFFSTPATPEEEYAE